MKLQNDSIYYWDGYEEHLKKYNEKITEALGVIQQQKEFIERIEEEKKKTIEEYKRLCSGDFEPKYYPFQNSENEELKKKSHDLIKSHELQYHMDHLLEKYHTKYNPICPIYEIISDESGNPKCIRCKKCFEKYILSKQTFDGTMRIAGNPGSSENS